MGGTPPDQRRRERSPAIYGARRRSGAAHLQPARGLCRDDACAAALLHPAALWGDEGHRPDGDARRELARRTDRKSVVSGRRGSVRVDLGGRRTIKKKKKNSIK